MILCALCFSAVQTFHRLSAAEKRRLRAAQKELEPRRARNWRAEAYLASTL